MIANHIIDQLRDMVDIVGLGRELIPGLQLRGAAWWSCCPFHREKSPSFKVDGQRHAFKCFGCGVSGDALDLIQRLAGLSFPEAVVELGRRAGFEVMGAGAASTRPLRHKPGPSRAARETPQKRPPAAEVRAVWEAAAPVVSMAEVYGGAVAAWLESRGLDPWRVEALDLARILPPPERVARLLRTWPLWGRFDGGSWWTAGYKLLFPLFDALGSLAGLRAGRIQGGGPKRISMSGVSSAGLALANLPARELLKRDSESVHVRVVIAEGEPDHLSAALAWPDLPSLGIWSGSWTPELATRCPDGAEVLIYTDSDSAGDRYAKAIKDSLGDRCRCLRPRRAS